jgi:hypothetical protein
MHSSHVSPSTAWGTRDTAGESRPSVSLCFDRLNDERGQPQFVNQAGEKNTIRYFRKEEYGR